MNPLIDEHGQFTRRGIRLTRKMVPLFRKMFLRCESARDVRDLEHILSGDLSVAASLRTLKLMCRNRRLKS